MNERKRKGIILYLTILLVTMIGFTFAYVGYLNLNLPVVISDPVNEYEFAMELPEEREVNTKNLVPYKYYWFQNQTYYYELVVSVTNFDISVTDQEKIDFYSGFSVTEILSRLTTDGETVDNNYIVVTDVSFEAEGAVVRIEFSPSVTMGNMQQMIQHGLVISLEYNFDYYTGERLETVI